MVALNTAFGSLYCDEITVSPVQVIPLLAAANLLQLVRTHYLKYCFQRLRAQLLIWWIVKAISFHFFNRGGGGWCSHGPVVVQF